ncbi:hypothetical protein AX17_002434 [Amanita inopinata Kibby_2008]|nr:hypothetical protein AX17_002434 [Amanita inopinata Kibby_2008]
MQAVDTGHGPQQQDTFDLGEQMQEDSSHMQMQAHADAASSHHYDVYVGEDEEGYSIMEHDSDEERDDGMYEEDDMSSELSIPDESINFDLVYSLHSFAATVEGQANVVKGDSLILMDDSNSYWWLVKVLKTQEVGYIPAENIETPFERLARLNKHRNVDLASATEHEKEGSQSHLRADSRLGTRKSPSPDPSNTSSKSRSRLHKSKSVQFNASFPVHRYLPAVWNEEEEEEDENMEWDDVAYIGEDPSLADEERERELAAMEALGAGNKSDTSMEVDERMLWGEMTIEEMQAQARARQIQQQQQQQRNAAIPASLLPGTQSQQRQRELLAQPQQQAAEQQHSLHHSSSRERMQMDPLDATETRKVTATPTIARDEDTINPGASSGSYLPSAVMEEETTIRAKRRAEEEAAAEEAKKRAKTAGTKEGSIRALSPSSIASSHSGGAKLKKEQSLKDKQKEKDRDRDADSEESGGSTKKKKGSVFRGLFGGGKKDKEKEKHKAVERGTSIGSLGSFASQESAEKDSSSGRISEESTRSGHRTPTANSTSNVQDMAPSPTTAAAMQLQQQQAIRALSPSGIQQQPQSQPLATPERQASLSPHASQLRQRDMQQQALYQQYLNRSPSSPPEVQPSYGLQSEPALMASSSFLSSPRSYQPMSIASGSNNSNSTNPSLAPPSTPRQRPGSLILMSGIDGQANVPDLSVIRVFAGRNLQTDATFKTVLLNSSTTAAELVKQAIQRFRLPPIEIPASASDSSAVGEGEAYVGGYYLTVKRVEGGASAVLRPNEKPLVVFESLSMQVLQDEDGIEAAGGSMPPKVNRNSIASISSVASLSMHPSIRQLPMNDFTDDSALKFYLNRRVGGVGGGEKDGLGGVVLAGRGDEEAGSALGHGGRYGLYGDDDDTGDHTLMAETSHDSASLVALGGDGELSMSSTTSSLGAEIHSSLAVRYPMIQGHGNNNVPPERFSSPSLRFALQLIIHPIDLPDDMVFHPFTEAIVPKDTLSAASSNTVSAPFRKKVFMFPNNVTVAEVIELGLERFGILEGVVDGGDEVEDKLAKRRSSSRVRYGLCIGTGNGQEKELAPSSKVIDAYPRPPAYRTQNPSLKRRSMDSALLLGNTEDVSPDDPVFILRRATSYRNSTSRHRMSAPLDEIALQHLHQHRDSTVSSAGSETVGDEGMASKSKVQPSRQEIIAAQRAAMRANQRAILSAQTNSLRGMDVLLPNNAVLRSSRYDSSDTLRYSYVEPDGESYDISDIVAEEWREHGRQDVLAGVVGRNRSAIDSDKLDRVLSKIKNGKLRGREREKRAAARAAAGHGGGGGGSIDVRSVLSVESAAFSLAGRSLSAVDSLRSVSPSEYSFMDDGTEIGSRSVTPGSAGLQNRMPNPHDHRRAGSAASAVSDKTFGAGGRPGTITPTGHNPNNYSVNTSGTVTPTGKMTPTSSFTRHNPTITSVISESPTGKSTPPPNPGTGSWSASTVSKQNAQHRSQLSSSRSGQYQNLHHQSRSRSQSQSPFQGMGRRPLVPKDDFGVENMMAVIECKAAIMMLQELDRMEQKQPQSEKQPQRHYLRAPLPPLDPVDEILFGRPVDIESLHPLVRDVYAGAFRQLGEMDKLLDEFMGLPVR